MTTATHSSKAKVVGIQTQSAELPVATAGSHKVDTAGGSLQKSRKNNNQFLTKKKQKLPHLGVGSRAYQLVLPLLADRKLLATGCPPLVIVITAYFHFDKKAKMPVTESIISTPLRTKTKNKNKEN